MKQYLKGKLEVWFFYFSLPVRFFLRGRTPRAAGSCAYTLSYDAPRYQPFCSMAGDIHVRTSREWGRRNEILARYIWTGIFWKRAR